MTYETVLGALADPTRRAILEMLRDGPRSVTDLADDLPVSRPAVSQHLNILRGANLVREERQGTRRFYSAEPEGLAELRAYLERFWGGVLGDFQKATARKNRRKK